MSLVAASLSQGVKLNNESYVSGTIDLTGDAGTVEQQSIADSATVAPVAIPATTVSKLVMLSLLSTEDITLTFTLGTGSKTIALKAGVPWQWHNLYVASIPLPFAYDIVSVTAANSSGSAAVLKIRQLVTA